MTDEKSNSPAADTPQTMGDLFEMMRQYDDAAETQEILDNILQKYAQYEQEAQEIKPKSIKGCSIDKNSKAILLNGKTEPALDPNSTKFNPAKYYSYAGALYDQLKQHALNLNKAYSGVIKSMLKTDAMQELFTNIQKMLAPLFSNVENDLGEFTNELYKNLFGPIYDLIENSDTIKERLAEWRQLQPYLEQELKKPEYNGRTLDDLITNEYKDENGNIKENSLFIKALNAAQTIAAQNAGRDMRRQLKANAEERGAIMEIRGGVLPVFSQTALYDAFAPGKISKLGTLSPDEIDKRTGRINKDILEQGEVLPLNASAISYKAFLLLNAIIANSVENFREEFVANGAIEFYVKGVLDSIEVDPRIKNDMQLNLDRKTAGVLYLEKELEPLLSFVGTTPNGSRYTVLNYEGYNVDSDTMTIRTPYLYQLWALTQVEYSGRKERRQLRQAEGKKPFKQDLKPLEINMLFKNTAYKEDDAVLEIATYITNVMLNAGRGAHKTEITTKTLIKNCSRLNERLTEISNLPNSELLENGKRRNNTARFNTELRKIAKAFSLIADTSKCDALKYFDITSIKQGNVIKDLKDFTAPTKSNIDEKITINWVRILN